METLSFGADAAIGGRGVTLAGTHVTADQDHVDLTGLMPSVILSHPQMGENIGSSARAMKNCGCSDLRLVAPRDGWPNPAAVAMASGGSDLLDTATVYPSTLDAAGDISLLVATTARRRGIAQTEMNPRQAASAIIAHHQAGGKAALLFGGERAGLDNDEVALANIIVTVPLNPSFSSLNLAQAVLLMGWECRMTALASLDGDMQHEQSASGQGDHQLAELRSREFFYDMLEEKMARGGFFTSPDMRPVVMRNIKAMFNKSPLSEQDIRTLHGIMKAVERSGHLADTHDDSDQA